MRVIKVLNNSIILAMDNNGKECILMGKGIGYQKSIGHVIRKEDIDKVFYLVDKNLLKNFIKVTSEIDEIIFTITNSVIDYAYTTYKIEVLDHLYLSLADHISFAIERTKQGLEKTNFNYIEIVKYHHDELDIGNYALKLIKEILEIELPSSEASSIGLHFVNATINKPTIDEQEKINSIINDIEVLVQKNLNTTLNKTTFSYSRFLAHITYFADRVVNGNEFVDEDNSLYINLTHSLPDEYHIVEEIGNLVFTKYQIKITNQEKLYLIIHIHRIKSEV